MRSKPYASLISRRCPWRLSIRYIHDHAAGRDWLQTARAVRFWIGPFHFEFGILSG